MTGYLADAINYFNNFKGVCFSLVGLFFVLRSVYGVILFRPKEFHFRTLRDVLYVCFFLTLFPMVAGQLSDLVEISIKNISEAGKGQVEVEANTWVLFEFLKWVLIVVYWIAKFILFVLIFVSVCMAGFVATFCLLFGFYSLFRNYILFMVFAILYPMIWQLLNMAYSLALEQSAIQQIILFLMVELGKIGVGVAIGVKGLLPVLKGALSQIGAVKGGLLGLLSGASKAGRGTDAISSVLFNRRPVEAGVNVAKSGISAVKSSVGQVTGGLADAGVYGGKAAAAMTYHSLSKAGQSFKGLYKPKNSEKDSAKDSRGSRFQSLQKPFTQFKKVEKKDWAGQTVGFERPIVQKIKAKHSARKEKIDQMIDSTPVVRKVGGKSFRAGKEQSLNKPTRNMNSEISPAAMRENFVRNSSSGPEKGVFERRTAPHYSSGSRSSENLRKSEKTVKPQNFEKLNDLRKPGSGEKKGARQ